MVDIVAPGQNDEALVEQLAAGLRTHPQAAANALKAIIEEARCRAASGDFPSIRDLADRADEAVEQVRAEAVLHRPALALRQARAGRQELDERLALLAMLAQQVLAMLAIVGGSDGRRNSGYYRAPLTHAERLDAMTEGVFRLVDLVNLIGHSEDQQIGESANGQGEE